MSQKSHEKGDIAREYMVKFKAELDRYVAGRDGFDTCHTMCNLWNEYSALMRYINSKAAPDVPEILS